VTIGDYHADGKFDGKDRATIFIGCDCQSSSVQFYQPKFFKVLQLSMHRAFGDATAGFQCAHGVALGFRAITIFLKITEISKNYGSVLGGRDRDLIFSAANA